MDFLVKQINKPFSAWVPRSKIMPNKCVMFFEEITKWVDEGSSIDVIYVDFQKAFFLRMTQQSTVGRFITDVRCTEHNANLEIGNGTKWRV